MRVDSSWVALGWPLPVSASARTWHLRSPEASARFRLATVRLFLCSTTLLNRKQYSHPWLGLAQVFEQQLHPCSMASSSLVLPLGLGLGQALAVPRQSQRPTPQAGSGSHKALILLERCDAGSLFSLVPERPRCKSESLKMHQSLCSDLEVDLVLYCRVLISRWRVQLVPLAQALLDHALLSLHASQVTHQAVGLRCSPQY